MNDEWNDRVPRDRPWNEYPVGTKAWALLGGHWIRVANGWKWHNGSTFPTPGGDAFDVTPPKPIPNQIPNINERGRE